LHRLYLDTNILIYALSGKSRPHLTKQARAILKKIELGIYQGVISEFVLMEVISGMRKLYFENCKEQPVPLKEVVAFVENTLFTILRHPNIFLFKSERSFQSLEWEALRLMNKYPGTILCNKQGVNKYRIIHPIDAIHILLAKEAECTALYTNDRAFKEAESEIKITLLEP
jgi:predicted nucleic acid-binding protein